MKTTLSILMCLGAISLTTAQDLGPSTAQWAGSGATTGNIYRSGNVSIGTITSPSKLLEVVPLTTNDGSFVSFGKSVGLLNGDRIFNFATSGNTSNFRMYGMNNQLSFKVESDPNGTFVALRESSGDEIFKAARDLTYGSYIHLPKANSRLVIGDYGSYLFSEGHKLVVKAGSAKIEGNILTDGKMGIGTDLFVDGSDTYHLSVNGKVRATSVKVYTDWADFVFEDDYRLPTLKEVATYIKQNGHLEYIPSAAEVEENGIDVGEMNKLLLQKVEELTLYLIEKDQQVEALVKDVAVLKQQLKQ